MASTRRDPWLDNVKMVLVTLVVIGHSWGLLAATDLEKQAYDFLYYWHVPAFVLVTGHLSRSFAWDRRGFRSLLTTCVVPYLIFEPALYFFRASLGQDRSGPVWLVPHWAMWYLCALFFWRLATPILKRHWGWLPASVAISLLGGLVSGQDLAMARVLGLLPFFVLGLHLDRRALDRLAAPWLKPVAVAALAWVWLAAASIDQWARSLFLLYDEGYAELGWSAGDGMRIRLTVMAIGLLGTAAALVLVPRRRTWFTSMGAASLVVYLCHGFVIRFAQFAGWQDWSAEHHGLSFVLTTGLAVALAAFLASPPALRVLTWAVDPVNSVQRHLRHRDKTLTPVAHPVEGPAEAPVEKPVRELVGPRSG